MSLIVMVVYKKLANVMVSVVVSYSSGSRFCLDGEDTGSSCYQTLCLKSRLSSIYLKYGPVCCCEIPGDYSVVYEEVASGRVFCMVSPTTTTKTVYYCINLEVFYFDFTFAGLQRKLNEKLSLSIEKIVNFLVLSRGEKPSSTFFCGVEKVQAGCCLEFSRGSIKINRFWSFDGFQNKLYFRNSNDYYESFLEIFSSSIKRCIGHENSSVGAHLSGGLDSSSIVSMAANILVDHGRKLFAFGSIPKNNSNYRSKLNWNLNDGELMQSIANLYSNVNLVKVYGTDISPFDSAAFCIRYSDGPFINPGNMGWMAKIMLEASEKGVSKILTGQMGNFTISWEGVIGGPALFLSRLKNFIHSRIGTNNTQKSNEQSNWWSRFSLFNPKHAKTYLPSRPMFCRSESTFDDPRVEYFSTDNPIGDLCGSLSSLERAYSVQLLDPTFDQEVVEFCLSVPNKVFCHGRAPHKRRMLIRESMRGILPETVRTRTTRGVQDPAWFLTLTKELPLWHDMINTASKHPIVQELIDVPRAKKLLEEWPKIDIMQISDKEYARVEHEYKCMLIRGLHVMHWIHLVLTEGYGKSS